MENYTYTNDVNWLKVAGLEAIEWAYNFASEDYQPGDYEDDYDTMPDDLPEDPDTYYDDIKAFITFDPWYIHNLLDCMGLLGKASSEEELNQIDDFFNQLGEYEEDLTKFSDHCLKDDEFDYQEWEDEYRDKMYAMIDDSCRY